MSQWSESDVLRINAQRRRRDDPGCAATGLTKTPEWVAKDALEILGAKPSKYRNVKTIVDGEKFDSKAESDYWLLLRARQHAGEITDLRRQVPFALYTSPVVKGPRDGKDTFGTIVLIQVAELIADYVFTENGQQRVQDKKSKATITTVFKLKARWLYLQSGIEVEIV